MKTITIVAVLVTAAFAAPPAAAQHAAPARSIAVGYADLDLGTERGRRMLDLRIAHAVAGACGEASSADLRGQNEVRACRVALRDQAAAQREVALASVRRSGVAALAARQAGAGER